MKKVIIAAPNYYTSAYQVGSHHYAKAFEKLGYQVAYISDPISTLHTFFAKSNILAERERIYNSGGFWEGNIWYYVPKALITPQNKPFLSSQLVMNHWFKIAKVSLVEILKRNGFEEVDILWFDSPIFHFLLDEISHRESILRLADDSKGLGVSHVHFNKELEIGNKANKVIYTAKSLLKTYEKIQDKSKMLYMPNGIDLRSFINCNYLLPAEFLNIPKPRVIYVGAIDWWFDVDLVYNSAIVYPEYSFILIGTCHISINKLLDLKNIYYLGSVSHEKIKDYLHHSDIGIIPFKQNEFVESIHPLKIYEYLAFGLKVVSMRWSELEQFEEYSLLAETSEEFIDLLSSSREFNKNDIESFLIENSWINKLQKIYYNSFNIIIEKQ